MWGDNGEAVTAPKFRKWECPTACAYVGSPSYRPRSQHDLTIPRMVLPRAHEPMPVGRGWSIAVALAVILLVGGAFWAPALLIAH